MLTSRAGPRRPDHRSSLYLLFCKETSHSEKAAGRQWKCSRDHDAGLCSPTPTGGELQVPWLHAPGGVGRGHLTQPRRV